MFTFEFDDHGWVWVLIDNTYSSYIQIQKVNQYQLWRYLYKPLELRN